MYIRRIICLLTLLCMLPTFTLSSAADTSVSVCVNNEAVRFDVPPVMQDDRILIPLHGMLETLGCDVFWNEEIETIIIVKNEIKLIMRASDKDFLKFTGYDFDLFKQRTDVKEYTFDVPPQIINGRIFVPIRAVCEAMDANVSWDDGSKTVLLTCSINSNADKAFADQAFAFLQQQENDAEEEIVYEEGKLDILTELGIVSEEDLNKDVYITNSEALETIHNVTGHYTSSDLKDWYGDEALEPLDYLDDDYKILLSDLLYYDYILTYKDVLSMSFDENMTYYKALVYVTRMVEDKGSCVYYLEELEAEEEKAKTYFIANQKKLIGDTYIENADLPIPRKEFYELIHKALFVKHIKGGYTPIEYRYIDSFLKKTNASPPPGKEVSVNTHTISVGAEFSDDMSISWTLPQDIVGKIAWTDVSLVMHDGTVKGCSTSGKVYTRIDAAQIILYLAKTYPEKVDYIRFTYYKYDPNADTRDEYTFDIDISNITLQIGGNEVTPGVYTRFQGTWIPESISLADGQLFKKDACYLITSYEHRYRKSEYNSVRRAVFKAEEASNILHDIYTDDNGVVLFKGSVYLEEMHLQEIVVTGTADTGFALYITPESKDIFTVKEGSKLY